MNVKTIIIIICFFVIGNLLLIPFYLANKKRKKKEEDLALNNQDKCILRVCGRNVFIDGKKDTEYENIGNSVTGRAVVLPAGTYEIQAKFETTSTGITGNRNYKMKEPVTCKLTVESGFQYSLDVYFYSAAERYDYYKGDVGEAIFETVLEVSGVGDGHNNVYIIGYKESDMNGKTIRAAARP